MENKQEYTENNDRNAKVFLLELADQGGFPIPIREIIKDMARAVNSDAALNNGQQELVEKTCRAIMTRGGIEILELVTFINSCRG